MFKFYTSAYYICFYILFSINGQSYAWVREISIFYLVRQPLTYMENMPDKIDEYVQKYQISEQSNYKEIDIIREANKNGDDSININMNFLGIDLSNVPSRNWGDPTVYIIPGLYVISSVISMRITTNQIKKKKENDEENIENENEKALVKKKDDDDDDYDAMEAMNKQMSIMMPIMAVSVALIAPLGLALYWLINNIITTVQRLILNKIFMEKEG